MRLDVRSPFVWRQINQLVKEKLGGSNNVYLYRGMHHAVFETLIGLTLRYGHKRKVVAETGFGDHLAHAEIELAKLGVRFKDTFEDDMAKEEKTCLAYIHDLDDAMTGALYDHIKTLKKVAKSKIYRIHLAHHLFQVRKSFVKNLSDFDIIIVSISREYALVFTGEKVVLPILTVSQLPWSHSTDAQAVLNLLKVQAKLFQPEITQFETSLPARVEPWFKEQPAKRIFDRAVVTLKDHDGAAMMDLLNQSLEIESAPLGKHNKVETPSLCRWQNEAWFNQVEEQGISRQVMQGTLMIDGALLSPQFSKVFIECLEKLKTLSQ